jgi:hypothetical protein
LIAIIEDKQRTIKQWMDLLYSRNRDAKAEEIRNVLLPRLSQLKMLLSNDGTKAMKRGLEPLRIFDPPLCSACDFPGIFKYKRRNGVGESSLKTSHAL